MKKNEAEMSRVIRFERSGAIRVTRRDNSRLK